MKRLVIIAPLLLAALAACSKKDDSDADTATTSTTGTVTSTGTGVIPGTITLSNSLAVAFPSSLALSVFPKSLSSLGLTGDAAADDPSTIKAKVAKQEERLAGKSDSCLDLRILKDTSPQSAISCYNFDADMNPFETADSNTRKTGTKDGTDGHGEACLVAFARNETEDSVTTIDTALDLFSGMLCQGKKDGVAKDLAAGESVDLKASFTGLGKGLITVTTASVSRLADADGAAVYRSDIAIAGEGGRTFEAHLVHSPAADGEKGTLWFLRTDAAGFVGAGANGQPAVDPNNGQLKNHVLSINYEKSTVDSQPHVAFEVRRASIAKTIEPFTADGLVNYAGVPADAQNDQISAIKYVAYDGNPDTGEGDLSYWQNPGGNYNESARGFLFNVTADATTGVLAGCGTSGATTSVSIRKALAEPSATNALAPTRYFHPQENHNVSADRDARYSRNDDFFITEQCFAQDATSLLYAIDPAKTDDLRGYAVIATARTKVLPPARPEKKLGEGDFAKP